MRTFMILPVRPFPSVNGVDRLELVVSDSRAHERVQLGRLVEERRPIVEQPLQRLAISARGVDPTARGRVSDEDLSSTEALVMTANHRTDLGGGARRQRSPADLLATAAE
jgi:hypothetical protein